MAKTEETKTEEEVKPPVGNPKPKVAPLTPPNPSGPVEGPQPRTKPTRT